MTPVPFGLRIFGPGAYPGLAPLGHPGGSVVQPDCPDRTVPFERRSS